MITLPWESGIDSTNEAMNHPMAGMMPPRKVRSPQPPSRQVTKIARSRTIATSGTGPRGYWKLPITPSSTPSTNSTR